MSDELLIKVEMEKYLKIAEVALDKWRKEGLPSIKLRRKVLFDKDEVLKWLNQKSKRKGTRSILADRPDSYIE